MRCFYRYTETTTFSEMQCAQSNIREGKYLEIMGHVSHLSPACCCIAIYPRPRVSSTSPIEIGSTGYLQWPTRGSARPRSPGTARGRCTPAQPTSAAWGRSRGLPPLHWRRKPCWLISPLCYIARYFNITLLTPSARRRGKGAQTSKRLCGSWRFAAWGLMLLLRRRRSDSAARLLSAVTSWHIRKSRECHLQGPNASDAQEKNVLVSTVLHGIARLLPVSFHPVTVVIWEQNPRAVYTTRSSTQYFCHPEPWVHKYSTNYVYHTTNTDWHT